MKRTLVMILIIALVLGTLVGCAANQSKIQEEFTAMTKEQLTKKNIKTAEEYLAVNLPKVNKECASYLVNAYEDFLLSSGDPNSIDYSIFADQYEKYIYKPQAELFRMKAEAQKNPLELDATLQYTWEEIGGKALEMEAFISKNKKDEAVRHLIEEDTTWIYGNYINTLIMGTNRTPIFNVESGEFSQKAKAAYEKIIKENPDTVTAAVLQEYSKYLKGVDYKLNYSDKVQSKAFFNTCTWVVSDARKRVYQ